MNSYSTLALVFKRSLHNNLISFSRIPQPKCTHFTGKSSTLSVSTMVETLLRGISVEQLITTSFPFPEEVNDLYPAFFTPRYSTLKWFDVFKLNLSKVYFFAFSEIKKTP